MQRLAAIAILFCSSCSKNVSEDRPPDSPAQVAAPAARDTPPAASADTIALLAKLGPGKGYKRDDMTVEITKRDDHWVTAGGEVVDEENVIDGGAIRWSPDRTWALVVVYEGCGDLCHEGAWLVGPNVDRMLEGDHPSVVAWNPKAPEVAIAFRSADMDGKETVSVGVFKLDTNSEARTIEGFGSPSYTADGKLEVLDAKRVKHALGSDGKLQEN